MFSYYYLRKNESNIFQGIFIVIFLILILLYHIKFISLSELISVSFPLLIIAINCPKIIKLVRYAVIDLAFIVFFLSVTLLWILEIKAPYKDIIIDDSKMVVFSSFLYAYLTYKMLQHNSDTFKQQRMPEISIDCTPKDQNTYIYTVKNNGDFAAKDIEIYFEIVYPAIKKGLKSAFFLFIIRKLDDLINFISIGEKRPKYSTFKVIKWLEPKEKKEISINDDISKLVTFGIKSKDEAIVFDVIVSWKYCSVDNLLVEDKFYKKFEYGTEFGNIKLIRDSNEPMTVY